MQRTVCHPGLSSEVIEARAYQLEAADEALSGSMMLVLPTAAGKTVVAWMVIADRLATDDGWILIVAPTVALVDQHLRGIEPVLADSAAVNPISITGQNVAKKRLGMWGSSRLVVATPQVVRNDVLRGVLDLSDCSLLVVDEAHHATGNHAMAQVGDLYLSQASQPLILATTASPGSKTDQVEEICSRLGIGRIHLRAASEAMLSKHLAGLKIQEVRVRVPDQIRELAEPLVMWQSGIVDREKRLGRYVMPGLISHAGLSNAMERAQTAISRGESSAYQSVSRIATAMRLHHLINHLLCQGIAASSQFLKRMSRGEQSGTKSTRNFLRDQRVSSLLRSLEKMREVHTKVGAVRRLIRERLRRDADSRIIVFATYRDTVAAIEKALGGVEGTRPIQFVGQSSRGGRDGLSPKQQVERLDEFRSGSANVLIATSVGEEGLDIPRADLVVFYEPVPSEIRTIQRRGRTGRHREGEVVVLIAEDTRDEGARAAAERKEEFMQRAVHRVRRRLPRSPHVDLSNLGEFEVRGDASTVAAEQFVREERGLHRTEISEVDSSESKEVRGPPDPLSPQTFRARGQTGLEQFVGEPPEPKEEVEETHSPISIARDLIALEEIGPPDVPGSTITADDRELNSAVIARLRALGSDVVIERLKTGDFCIGERILVERKTVRDFVDSLVDGRLLEQASRLVGAAPRTLILIEGEGLFQNSRVHPHALMGALTTLTLDFGIPVVTTKDGSETARFLTVAARREESMLDGLSESARERLEAVRPEFWNDPVTQAAAGAKELRQRHDDHRAAARALLEAIPSVDDELAACLLDRFGTIAALAWAEEGELREIDGISEDQVREICRTFRSGEQINP